MNRIDEVTDEAPAGQAARQAGRTIDRGARIAAWLLAALMLSACDSGDGSGSGGAGAQSGAGAQGGGGSGTGAQGGAGGAGGQGGVGGQGGGGSTSTGGSGGAGGSSGDGIGTACPFGTECPESAPACISQGVGDATAYCSIHDCGADADCPTGFYCGITRDPHGVCNSNPPKGDNNQCGMTSEPCIDPAIDPTSIFEGSLCLLRRTCLYRDPCAPCASDIDCSGKPAQKCVSIGGELRCARECGGDGDCLDDETCSGGTCAPRFGACEGTGLFCEPCDDDEDCGTAGTSMACAELSGGQRACFDFAFPDTCTTDNDCPMAPSGKRGECLDAGEGLGPGDPLYHRCYLPFDAADNNFGCW
jgi:hypothetical protein